MTPQMIRKNYPEILSSEQVRQILGVSKRKVSWLLNNGHIPCQFTGKATHAYLIRREDIIRYLKNREDHPEKYAIPSGIFSTAKYRPQKSDAFPAVLPQDFRAWLEDAWYGLPDVLNAEDIVNETGYSKNTVLRWLRTKRLQSVLLPHDVVSTKEWLIDLYCGDGYQPKHMCEKHKELMRQYLNLKNSEQ